MLRAWLVTGQHAHARERAASAAQYVLLGGFAAVAAGISAHGLTGFARSDMELAGPWPYLLFLALDGAAGVCAVLLVRRAARAESGLAPRLAVWGLVAASSTFNWTHAPRRAAAQLAHESWANILLISSRIPAATVVKGYQAWRAAGRQVNRDETGTEIFASPHQQVRTRRGDQEGDAPNLGWRDAHRVTYVWDLSQTSGQPLPVQPATCSPSPNVPPGLWDSLCWLARREGFAVEREPGCPADGTTLWAARRIRILPGLAPEQAVWALAHQLGHVLLHNTTAAPPDASTSFCQGVRKAEADSIAFITCIRHGV